MLATLQVKDRSNAQLRSVVLVAADYEGHRYLVSMLGDGSEWVQNLRWDGVDSAWPIVSSSAD
jgi:hypothetical protein